MSKRRGTSGFLLIAVLLLLALLTVLVVASVMVAQLERRASSNSASNQLAQQNALFALNVALGQLQREAGPDQRVTARADIISTGTLAPPIPTSTNGATAYWTGVWKTYNPAGGPNQQLDVTGTTTGLTLRQWSTGTMTGTTGGPRWLVSLPPSALTLNPSTPLPTGTITIGGHTITTVTVANVGSAATAAITGTTTAAACPVNVPLVPMITTRTLNNSTTSVQTGQYAYWVSDEGIKAKANLIDPNVGISPTSNLVDSQRQFLAPAANALYTILPSPLSTDFRTNPSLSKVSTPLSLQFISNGTGSWTTAVANQNLADFTTYSMGVLADVRKGGLKTDLTAALETGTICNTLFPYATAANATTTGYDTQYVYRAVSGNPNGGGTANSNGNMPYYGQTTAVADAFASTQAASGDYYDGLPWQTAYYFYNLYKGAMPPLQTATVTGSFTGIQATTTNPNSFGSTGYAGTSLDWYTWKYPNQAPVILPLAPVILADRLDVSFEVAAPVPPATNWTVTLKSYPQIILWNPYSVPINASSFSLTKDVNLFTKNGIMMWVAPSGTPTGTLTASKTPTAEFPLGSGNNYITTRSDSTPFQPGEIRIYSFGAATGTLTAGDGFNAGTLATWIPGSYPANDANPLFQFPQTGTTTPPDEPISLWDGVPADAPNGDYGQIMTVSLGTLDTAGNPITLGTGTSTSTGTYTDEFYILLCTASAGTNSTTDPSSISTAPNYTSGDTSDYESASKTASWPIQPSYASGHYFATGVNIGGTAATPNWGTPLLSSVITNGPYRVFSFEARMKGLQSSLNTTGTASWGSITNTAPLFMGNTSLFDPLDDNVFGSCFTEEHQTMALNPFSANDTSMAVITGPLSASPMETDSVWGMYSAGDGPNNENGPAPYQPVVLYDIPNQPMVSLGQFMHMPLYIYYYLYNISGNKLYYNLLPGATMFVGGSLACPEVPLNETGNVFTAPNGTSTPLTSYNPQLYLDNSFLANQALFDSYFFSTVPPPGGFSFPGGTTPPGVYTNIAGNFNSTYIQNNKPLPNRRMRYYYDNGTAPAAANLQSPYLAAANLMVDGAFNVNSTSVPAWTALLSSLGNNQLQIWNTNPQTPTTTSFAASTSQTPIPRFWSSNGTAGGPWDGTHLLTNPKITALANDIVAQVKLRGPFLSMADFLNRRLAPSGTGTYTVGSLYTAGAIQAAIDTGTYTGASTINATALTYGAPVTASNTYQSTIIAKSATSLYSRSTSNLPPMNTIVSSTAVGIPAYLMQQDIVQAFAPVMTVRSDTFVIRVYGESDNVSTKAVEGRAWGEAVVQRLPDYVDQTDPALTTAPSTTSANVVPPITTALGNATPIYDSNGVPLLNTTNQTFGRRFKIVSFHWLNPNDL